MRKIDKINHIQKVNRLTEDRQNAERTVIKELFGLSADERKTKEKQVDMKQAYNEISNFNFLDLLSPLAKSNSFKDNMNIINDKLTKASSAMPTLNKLLPMMFDTTESKGGLIYVLNDQGKSIPMVFPAAWNTILARGKNKEGQYEVDGLDNIRSRAKIGLANKIK